MMHVTGYIHKGSWQGILIVSCLPCHIPLYPDPAVPKCLTYMTGLPRGDFSNLQPLQTQVTGVVIITPIPLVEYVHYMQESWCISQANDVCLGKQRTEAQKEETIVFCPILFH